MVLKITDYKYFPIFVYPLMPVFKWCSGFHPGRNLNLASYMWKILHDLRTM